MKPLPLALALLTLGPTLLLSACGSPYVDTYEPTDAAFDVTCEPGCGPDGRDNALVIGMSFKGGERKYALCCEHRAELLARLQTIKDHWCDELDVPPKTIGGLVVGTTLSEVSKERGATIDDGEGYLTFNCDGWLEQLLDKLSSSTCCGSLAVEAAARSAGPADPR